MDSQGGIGVNDATKMKEKPKKKTGIRNRNRLQEVQNKVKKVAECACVGWIPAVLLFLLQVFKAALL